MNEFLTVYLAELKRRLRSKPFLIGLLVGTLAVVFMFKSPLFFNSAFTGPKTAILLGDPEITDRAAKLLADDFTISAQLPSQHVTQRLLLANDASTAIDIGVRNKHLTLSIYARDPASVPTSRLRSRLLPLQVQVISGDSEQRVSDLLQIPVKVQTVASIFTNADQAQAAHSIAYVLLFFLYLLILLNSQLLMSSVAEEKTTRIAELLVASVDPVALLAGKIAAAGTLALSQLGLWLVVGALSSTPAQGAVLPTNDSTFDVTGLFTGDILSPFVIVSFVLFFILGFLQVSTLFAGFASLVNRTEDLGSLQTPLVIPVIGALFIAMAALGSPETPWVLAASMIPIVSPFVMFARMAVSNVPVWEVAFALLINIAALGVITIFAGKLYRVGMLLYGRPPKLRQIISVIRNN
jgi:ABC-2 type transport system permease protein